MSPTRHHARMLSALAIFSSATIACRGERRAGDNDASEAAAVADRFLSALAAERWDSAAAVIDSAEAQHFRDQQLALLAGIAENERDITQAMSATGSGGLTSMGSALALDTAMVARRRGRTPPSSSWPAAAGSGAFVRAG